MYSISVKFLLGLSLSELEFFDIFQYLSYLIYKSAINKDFFVNVMLLYSKDKTQYDDNWKKGAILVVD